MMARSRRRRRLRATAGPTGLPTANATAATGEPPSSTARRVIVSAPTRRRTPSRRRAAKDARSRTRQRRAMPTAVLRGELAAALAATRLEDRPTGAGRHAVAEAVLLRPAARVGLERALHECLRSGVPTGSADCDGRRGARAERLRTA